jgi:hypothetical protein
MTAPHTLPPATELTRAQYDGWACCRCSAPLWAGARSAGIARGRSGVHVLDVEVFECSPHCPAPGSAAQAELGSCKTRRRPVTICARCDQPIRDGEPYDEVDKFSPSGAGATLLVHRELCERPPTQTAPLEIHP